MAVNPRKLVVVEYPNPVLRKKAKPVGALTAEVRAVARRMLELMHEARGVGLAAPQVGLSWRMFVACPTTDPSDDRVFVNPALSEASREAAEYEEGCLSIPDVRGQIRRPSSITIRATDLNGEAFEMRSNDLAARVWQHETDHLDGVLIIDRMTAMDRLANDRKLRELERQAKARGRKR